ncbi:MAG: PIN domain-containing protein [Acidobacteria bacterium]|nr:PIN domain-containing protein [Acidobacteriota bacterium]
MTPAILADTGPLYAAADPSDQHHRRAQRELDRIKSEGITIVVAYPTLLEAYTLVLRRLGARQAHTWLQEILAGADLTNPSPQDYKEAARRAQQYPDQPLTLFDTVLAALCERLALPVWTYDRHFELLRAKLWR